jgi:NAD+ synthase/NAD+ synthase (glutamine-hydrolysing)
LGFVDKRLLPTYDVFDEDRYFEPSQKQNTVSLEGVPVGVTICEDVWNDKNFWANRRYDRDPVTEIIGQGTTVLLNISASPYTIDKRSLRFEMLRSIAITHRRPVIYVNQVGGDDSLIFDGASMALTADGKVAAQAFAFQEDLVIFDTATGQGELRALPTSRHAIIALVTGTYDYVRSAAAKVLVGLSGGIDLSVAAIAVDIWCRKCAGYRCLAVLLGGARGCSGLAESPVQFVTVPSCFDSYRRSLAPAFEIGRRT